MPLGVLLESCLADKLAFVERNRRFIRNLVEEKIWKGSPRKGDFESVWISQIKRDRARSLSVPLAPVP